MVNLLFVEDDDALRKPGIVKTLYDPACGTGGMLGVAEEYLRELNPGARLEVFGQELNDESFAICKRHDDQGAGPREHQARQLLLRGRPPVDYMLSNPPFGVEWKKVEDAIRKEKETAGYAGRFGAGLPRINDGSFLFLQHMIAKMKPEGSRIAVVFNGSPLFTGDAGSGESEIRRWIIEHDWLEAHVALPDQHLQHGHLHVPCACFPRRSRLSAPPRRRPPPRRSSPAAPSAAACRPSVRPRRLPTLSLCRAT